MSTSVVVRKRKSLVEQAFELAEPVEGRETLKDELTALQEAHRRLLPIEQDASEQLAYQIGVLEKQLRQSEYPEPVLPFEPLGWRWPNGMPKLALLSLKDPTVTFQAHISTGRTRGTYVSPEYPSQLRALYDDVLTLAASHCWRPESSRSYSFTFKGVLPASVRESISAAGTSGRFNPDQLYLLTEAPEKAWEMRHKKGLARRTQLREAIASIEIDPLIVGYAHKSLFVIDKFDLTTLEEYVFEEFAVRALPAGPSLG